VADAGEMDLMSISTVCRGSANLLCDYEQIFYLTKPCCGVSMILLYQIVLLQIYTLEKYTHFQIEEGEAF